MLGRMMQRPLLISAILQHAERHHPHAEVVSRRVEGDLHRTSYAALARRARQVANALAGLGVQPPDRVGTLAWNGYRHLELYYGVSGAGSVLHTLNPRLHVDQLAYIANHAEDRVLFFDLSFLPLVEQLAQKTTTVRHFVALCDRDALPASNRVPLLLSYEEMLDGAGDSYDWPDFDENTASSLCYTSGTTGNPKGVLYSHRSTLLNAFAAAMPDVLCVRATDVLLPVVPMFHINAWGIVYLAPMVGAKLVLPGPALDGRSLYELIEAEAVTTSAGVPTVWQGLLAHVESNQLTFSTMRASGVGGSACPPALIHAFERLGVRMLHAWGMTETSPIATTTRLKQSNRDLDDEARLAVVATQGRSVFGVDMKITDDDGAELPWDGASRGDLLVRGPWVADGYFKDEGGDPKRDGWFHTGDVARITPDGYMVITDRSKDVIKSGGEWISSIDVESVAMAHPAVAMAACIAMPHPTWGERPLLVVVKKPGCEVDRDALLGFFDGKVARWWTPDDVVFVDAIPLGGTGKMLKAALRERFRDHVPAGA